jgi:peptide deformylase
VILKLAQAGEPVLRQAARPLSPGEILGDSIRLLIESMKETMRDAPGVGLAAPQVGHSLQLAVIEDSPLTLRTYSPAQLADRDRGPVPFHVIINPVITTMNPPISDPQPRSAENIPPAASQVEFFEGCLSLAGFVAIVPRARKVRVECLNERGEATVIEASGWYARILQHEIDHLRGTLYVDRMHTRSLMTVDEFNRHWKDKPLSEVKSLLQIKSNATDGMR